MTCIQAVVAQSVERILGKDKVTGSIPVNSSTHGGLAQLARACGSYPQCPRFKSRCRYQTPKDGTAPFFWDFPSGVSRPAWATWPVGQVVKTPPFHGGNTGSSPVRVTNIWRRSSAGRALASHARGHRFEFCRLHQKRTSVRMSFLL